MKRNFLKFWMLLFLLLSAAKIALSQNGGTKIRLVIYPVQSKIKIDNQPLINTADTVVQLSEGVHHLKIWAPKMGLVDTSLTVIKDSSQFFYAYLHYTNDYRDYVHQLTKYKIKKFTTVTFPPILAVGAITGLKILANSNHNKALEEIGRYDTLYNPDGIELLKSDLDHHKKMYKLYNGLFYGVIGISAIATYFYVKHVKKMKSQKPEYKVVDLLSRMDVDFNYLPTEKRMGLTAVIKF